MADKITGFLIDVTRQMNARPVEFENNLENIYKLLDIDLIDVAVCRVGDKAYDFIVDDEGLLKAGAIPSVFDADGRPVLVGNVLVVNSNEDGDFTSLNDKDVENLCEHVKLVVFSDKLSRLCVFGAEQE